MATAKPYKHILYATDLGPHEKKVRARVKAACELHKAKITIVHVVESMPVFMDMSGYLNTAEIIDRMQDEARALIKKIGEDLKVDEADQHIIIGAPKADIVTLADKVKSDLIIIGAHNRHLIDNLIGSTTDAVLRAAHCDVLTVRYKED